MTLRDLIDSLTEIAEVHGDDVEVRIAHQPRWPLEYAIGEVAVTEPGRDDDDDDDDDEEEDTESKASDLDDTESVVYIGEGTQLGYLSGHAAKLLGWSRR